MSWLAGLIIHWIVSALLLMVVDRLNVGLKVASFGSALVAALVIAVLTLVTHPILVALQLPFRILPLDVVALIVYWIFSAIVLFVVARFVKGFRILGFGSALVVALVLGLLTWLADIVLRSL
jgi:putative membrane protein